MPTIEHRPRTGICATVAYTYSISAGDCHSAGGTKSDGSSGLSAKLYSSSTSSTFLPSFRTKSIVWVSDQLRALLAAAPPDNATA